MLPCVAVGHGKFTPAPYHELSFDAKEQHQRDQLREPAVACPADCGTQVQPSDLLQHAAERCPGPRQPARGGKSLTETYQRLLPMEIEKGKK